MSLVDFIEAGSVISDMISVQRGINQLKQSSPEGDKTYKVLEKVCSQSKLNFMPVTIEPNLIGFSSTKKIDGVFNQPAFRSLAAIYPPKALVRVFYFPEEGIFVDSNSDGRLFANWINSQVPNGKYFKVGPKKSLTRNDIVQYGYEVSVSYKNLQENSLSIALSYLINVVKFFEQTYSGSIIDARKLQTQFIFDGVPNFDTTKTDQASLLKNQSRRTHLQNDIWKKIVQRISERFPDTSSFDNDLQRIKILALGEIEFELIAYQSHLGHLVIESREVSSFSQYEINMLATSNEILTMNARDDFSGNFHVDFSNRQVLYRNGMTLASVESSDIEIIVDALIQEHGQAIETEFGVLKKGIKKLFTIGGPKPSEHVKELHEPIEQTSQGTSTKPEIPSMPIAPKEATPNTISYEPIKQGDQSQNNTTPLMLEALPGIIGFLGIGWIQSGNTGTGIALLLGMFVWDAILLILLVVTAGLGCFCLFPLHFGIVALSTYLLNQKLKQKNP